MNGRSGWWWTQDEADPSVSAHLRCLLSFSKISVISPYLGTQIPPWQMSLEDDGDQYTTRKLRAWHQLRFQATCSWSGQNSLSLSNCKYLRKTCSYVYVFPPSSSLWLSTASMEASGEKISICWPNDAPHSLCMGGGVVLGSHKAANLPCNSAILLLCGTWTFDSSIGLQEWTNDTCLHILHRSVRSVMDGRRKGRDRHKNVAPVGSGQIGTV